jgi:hypothetical protein
LEDGRDALAALQTYRQTSERWKAAYSDLRTEFITSNEEIKNRMADFAAQLNGEREAWKAEIKRSRANALIWIIVAGGVGGAVGYAAGR